MPEPHVVQVEWNSAEFEALVDREAANRMRDAVAFCTDYAKTNMYHGTPSPEGGFPGIVTGHLRASIGFDVEIDKSGVTGRFGVLEKERGGKPLDYALYLEIGTSRMAPRPWLTLTLDGTRDDVKRILGVT